MEPRDDRQTSSRRSTLIEWLLQRSMGVIGPNILLSLLVSVATHLAVSDDSYNISDYRHAMYFRYFGLGQVRPMRLSRAFSMPQLYPTELELDPEGEL